MLRLLRNLLAVLLLCLAGQGLAAGTVDFKSVRLWAAPDNTRVVFDVSGPHTYKLFTLQNPERVVIDVPAGRAAVRSRPTQYPVVWSRVCVSPETSRIPCA